MCDASSLYPEASWEGCCLLEAKQKNIAVHAGIRAPAIALLADRSKHSHFEKSKTIYEVYYNRWQLFLFAFGQCYFRKTNWFPTLLERVWLLSGLTFGIWTPDTDKFDQSLLTFWKTNIIPKNTKQIENTLQQQVNHGKTNYREYWHQRCYESLWRKEGKARECDSTK